MVAQIRVKDNGKILEKDIGHSFIHVFETKVGTKSGYP
jgi:hypothetical protein